MEKTLDRLNTAIAYARTHCDFYSYLPAQPLKSMEEYKALPFVTAEDILSRGKSMICIPASGIKRMVTSGTTGERKRLAFSSADLEATVEFFSKGMHRLCNAGDTVAILMPGTTPDGVGALLSQGLANFGAKSAVYGYVSDYADAAAFCRWAKPEVIVGVPAQVRRLALTAPKLRPKRVLLSADYAAHSLRGAIERIWGCEVYIHYGLTETGLGCAVETPERDGLHIRDDVFVEEIGGELVISTLGREAMPLLRYRTGDCAAILPNGHIGEVFGRRTELEKPIPIYSLDEELFSCDEILDYSAICSGGKLKLSVVGNTRRAKELLVSYRPLVSSEKSISYRTNEKRAVGT